MSGNSLLFARIVGSNFFASACASPFCKIARRFLSVCKNIGTEASYIGMVIVGTRSSVTHKRHTLFCRSRSEYIDCEHHGPAFVRHQRPYTNDMACYLL